LDAYNFKLTSKNVFIDASENADPYLVIKDDNGRVILHAGSEGYFL
jgi:hypothetical protein